MVLVCIELWICEDWRIWLNVGGPKLFRFQSVFRSVGHSKNDWLPTFLILYISQLRFSLLNHFLRVVCLSRSSTTHIYTIRQAIVLALGTPTSSSGLLYWTIVPKQSPGSASFSSIFFHARSDMGCGLVCSWDIWPFVLHLKVSFWVTLPSLEPSPWGAWKLNVPKKLNVCYIGLSST